MYLNQEILVQLFHNITTRPVHTEDEQSAMLLEVLMLDKLIRIFYNQIHEKNPKSMTSEDDLTAFGAEIFPSDVTDNLKLLPHKLDFLLHTAVILNDIASSDLMANRIHAKLCSRDQYLFSSREIRQSAFQLVYAITHYLMPFKPIIEEKLTDLEPNMKYLPIIFNLFRGSLGKLWEIFNKVHSSNVFVCLMPLETTVSKLCYQFDKSAQHLQNWSIANREAKCAATAEMAVILRELVSIIDIELDCAYINNQYLFHQILLSEVKHFEYKISLLAEQKVEEIESPDNTKADEEREPSKENTGNEENSIHPEWYQPITFLNTVLSLISPITWIENIVISKNRAR